MMMQPMKAMDGSGGAGGPAKKKGTGMMAAPPSGRNDDNPFADDNDALLQPERPLGGGGGGGGASGTSVDKSDGESARMWSVHYYKRYFDVDTRQVGARVVRSLLPVKPLMDESVGEAADLYGPFWVCTTLIFVLAVTHNFSGYLRFLPSELQPEWNYDFNKVVIATSLIYSYATLVPLAVWGLLKYFGVEVQLTYTLCVYGYSLAVYNLLSIALVLSHTLNWLAWLFVFLSCLISTAVLVTNGRMYAPYIPKKISPFVLGILGMQFCFGLVFKVLFF